MRFGKAGFTLIELLVVIGIIAVLAGISLPIMQQVSARARTVACVSNLRNLYVGMEIYLPNNNYIYPSAPEPSGYYSWDEQIRATGAFGSLAKAAPNKVLQCPGYSLPHTWRDYSMNANLRGVNKNNITAKETMIFLTDWPNNGPIGDTNGSITVHDPARVQVHNGKNNFLFVDGHVECLTNPSTVTPINLWALQ